MLEFWPDVFAVDNFTAPGDGSVMGFTHKGRRFGFPGPVPVRAGDLFAAAEAGLTVNGRVAYKVPRRRMPFLPHGPKDWMPRPPARNPCLKM